MHLWRMHRFNRLQLCPNAQMQPHLCLKLLHSALHISSSVLAEHNYSDVTGHSVVLPAGTVA